MAREDPAHQGSNLGTVTTNTSDSPESTPPSASLLADQQVADQQVADLTAADVAWDLDTLIEGTDLDSLLDQSDQIADQLETYRGRVGSMTQEELVTAMRLMADLQEVQGRAGYYAMLRFSENTSDPERGALMMRVQERSVPLATRLVFFELEWAALDDDAAEAL